jgi:mono/diheme cytochrome c family protein
MRMGIRHLLSIGLLCGAMASIPSGAMAADSAAGKAVFDAKCKSCHGADGAGNPAIAKMMKVEMNPLSSAEVQKKSDAELKAVVTMGTGKMKPVATVTGADLDNVVAYVHSMKK